VTRLRTAGKQRGRPFPPGASGNVTGRPRGSRNRASVVAAALSDSDATAIVLAVVGKAKSGNMVAAKIILDRIWPTPKGSVVTFLSLSATDARGIVEGHALLLQCVAAGETHTGRSTSLVGQCATNMALAGNGG
jgi:Family of unknown function (DUF5681)